MFIDIHFFGKYEKLMITKIITIDADEPFTSIEQLRNQIDKSPVKRIAVTSNGKIIGLVREKFIVKFKRYSRHFDVKFS